MEHSRIQDESVNIMARSSDTLHSDLFRNGGISLVPACVSKVILKSPAYGINLSLDYMYDQRTQ
jgi:hypothetical protein